MRSMVIPVILVALIAAPASFAQQAVYPAKGQSSKQQEKDKNECYGWAKKQTGVDPVALANQASAPPPKTQHGQAARGAAGGAVIGGLAGNAGAGAAAGATAGAMGKRRAQKQSQQQQQAGQAQVQEQLDTFNRANAACLKGRGYEVQ